MSTQSASQAARRAALDDSVDVKTIAANLRVAAAVGSALPVDIHRQFKERFGVTILEGYGRVSYWLQKTDSLIVLTASPPP